MTTTTSKEATMIAKLFRKLLGIKEPKKPAAPVAKARLETLIRAENRTARPRQATSGSGRRRDTGDDANDLLNPLNPLSPLSPISPLNPLNQVEEPFSRQRVEDDAVSRAGHHDHRGFLRKEEITSMNDGDVRRYVPAYREPSHSHSHSHKTHDDDSGRHSHSHSYSGGHSHSSHDSGSYDSGSSDSGGGGGGSD